MNILDKIKEFSDTLPHFDDGRINYSTANIAPILAVFVFVNDEMILLKRSDKVANYQGIWNTVVGFLDEVKPIKEKVLEELKEEINVAEQQIEIYKEAVPYELPDNNIGKTWLVQAVLVKLKEKPEITLDWEHTEYQWILPEQLKEFETVPDLDKSLAQALK